ncbi:MAG TPA: aspartate kinase [Aeromonadales bacterium]|nr:aspartate kinase [Aeromonadales bacterium]
MLNQHWINRDESMTTGWVVLKFGGSSVAEARHWQTILKIIQKKIHSGLKPVLVLSALKNVSNQLEELLMLSLSGEHQQALENLKHTHLTFAKSLNLDGETILSPSFELLKRSCDRLNQSQQLTAREHAHIVSFGEIFSSLLGHAFLSKQLPAQWLDVRSILKPSRDCYLKTRDDNWHRYVSAEFELNYSRSLDEKLTCLNKVIITQGFIGCNDNNETILLGREGSDTTAAYLGVLLEAKNVEIWTDVCGVFTTNPRENHKARQILKLGYDEARRMAAFGAKILHPRALKPLASGKIPLSVHGMDSFLKKGTEISENSENNYTIYAVVNEVDLHLLSVPMELATKVNLKINALYNRGFDRVFETIENEQSRLLLKYNNSVKPAPDDAEIQSLFENNAINFKSDYGLITLIGKALPVNRTSPHWIYEVLEYVKNNDNLQFTHLYVFESVGRLSFLIRASDLKFWNEKLHAKYIENQFELHPSDYGVGWE